MNALRKSVRALLFLGLIATFGIPEIVAAQEAPRRKSLGDRIKDAARALDRLTCGGEGDPCQTAGSDSAEALGGSLNSVAAMAMLPPTAGVTGTTGSAQFGVLTVSWKVLDDGTQIAAPPPPPMAGPIREQLGCPQDRPCAPRADLRVLRVNTHGQALAKGVPFVADVSVENRGRTPSSAAEGVVCRAGYTGCEGDGASAQFIIPPLAVGERITTRIMFTEVGDLGYGDHVELRVLIDPDEAVADFSRTNNTVTLRVAIEEVKLVMREQTVLSGTTANRNVRPAQTFRIQNPSRSIATGAVPLLWKPHVRYTWFNGECRRLYNTELFALPSFPPKALVEVTVHYPPLFATCPNGASYSWSRFEATDDSPHGLGIDLQGNAIEYLLRN